MKVFLINRSDVLFFSGETKLKVKKENGREFIDAPVLQDGKIVLRIITRTFLSELVALFCILLDYRNIGLVYSQIFPL